MNKKHVLADVVGSLMLSYATIITTLQLVNRFMTPLYGALLIIAGLIAAVVFLFIDEDNRRNMRIVSISCNSIAIGSIIGVLFQLLGYTITVFNSVIIGALFLGIVFLIYLLFYNLQSRMLPGLIAGVLLIIFNLLYWESIYPEITLDLNAYIVMFDAITIIHYIIALIVVPSKEITIIDGMSYGYFGLTLVILVVAGIFLLIASDGDVDVDLPSIGDGKREKKSSVSKKAYERRDNMVKKAQFKKETCEINIPYSSYDNHYSDIHVAESIVDGLYYMQYLDDVYDTLTIAQVRELEQLEKDYREGKITLKEYQYQLEKYRI